VEKVPWRGAVTSAQPRIRLLRSFDQRSHSYLGYVLRMNGEIGDEHRDFTVGIGKGAHAKHGFRVDDRRREMAMAGETLRQQDVLGTVAEVGDGGVPQAMKTVDTVEAGELLPTTKNLLVAELREAVAALRPRSARSPQPSVFISRSSRASCRIGTRTKELRKVCESAAAAGVHASE